MIYEQQSYNSGVPVWEDEVQPLASQGYLTYKEAGDEDNNEDDEGVGIVWRDVGYFGTAERRRLHGDYNQYLEGGDDVDDDTPSNSNSNQQHRNNGGRGITRRRVSFGGGGGGDPLLSGGAHHLRVSCVRAPARLLPLPAVPGSME